MRRTIRSWTAAAGAGAAALAAAVGIAASQAGPAGAPAAAAVPAAGAGHSHRRDSRSYRSIGREVRLAAGWVARGSGGLPSRQPVAYQVGA